MNSYKLVMPEDMNHYGFLFGGKMLMWVDEIAWIAVSNEYPGLRFVTIGMGEVSFKQSVRLRSVLRFQCDKVREGHTSVTYHVEVFSRKITAHEERSVFHTDITFVRVDEQGNKILIHENNQQNQKEKETMDKFVCEACGYVYDPAEGDPEHGIPAGTPFDKLPEDWTCPLCGMGKEEFKKEN